VPSPGWFEIDKVYHFIEYGILSFLLCRAFMNSQRKRLSNYAMLFAILATVVFGMTDEIHQAFVPNRSSSVADWVSDALGAIAGIFILRIWLKLYPQIMKRFTIRR
jgi:VanZ family protein